MTLKFYKCACSRSHLHKITNLTKKIVSTGQFTFDYKVLKRYLIRKIVKQGIIWFSNMQIRYFKDLCEPCLGAPEQNPSVHLSHASCTPILCTMLEKQAPNHQSNCALCAQIYASFPTILQNLQCPAMTSMASPRSPSIKLVRALLGHIESGGHQNRQVVYVAENIAVFYLSEIKI